MSAKITPPLLPTKLSRNDLLDVADKFDHLCAELLGWTNLHGAPPDGAYLRGTPPWERHSGKVLPVPRFITGLFYNTYIHRFDNSQGIQTDSKVYEQYENLLAHLSQKIS